MLIHEDIELERAILEDKFCVCVPVSVWLEEGNTEPEITAYNCVWDICSEYEKRFGGDPFCGDATDLLCGKIAPVMRAYGYELDSKESRVNREYRITETDEKIADIAKTAMLVRSAEQIAGIPCLCLHDPDPDYEDEAYACAVVICDGAICAVAGVNDLFTDDTHEIFVETAKEYRGRGFATAAVAALTKHLTGLGYTVGYKCGEDNKASVAVAEKVGMPLAGRRYDLLCYAD